MNKQNREFQAFAGHLVDLYRLASFKFSNPHSYTKFRAIKNLQKQTQSKTLIETGTYLGVTTNRCASVFEKVYTVELDEALADKARVFLAPKKNVEVIQGDGLEMLAHILEEKPVSDALIFLDGHASGGDTACGDLPEPAIEELKTIANHKQKVNAIIIDDFRTFGTDKGFPSKSAILQVIEENFSEYDINVHLDQILITKKSAVAARAA
ncbi:rRNA adenine N-6-methyltransferase family protein [Leptothoe sp. PORK10 BA2]|uniref:rRNA adenine N-6-methyltransferase family protein n=1 Tax=Leptothoe sp. PORK10 BA2 TaxID=3110254 RepID=UPI002B21CCA9|nr:rRNA adenine N-6-methyltransferase family protein [Leptothoe sp. PORK10 BA2]MEA5466509.1 rRNA adenine N-6-methyltransferase family protein [Leptothoe sp. PORK10 BA2]